MFLKSLLSNIHWVPTLQRTLGMVALDSTKPQSSNWAHHLDKEGGSQGRWMYVLSCKWVTQPSFSGVHKSFIKGEENFWNTH